MEVAQSCLDSCDPHGLYGAWNAPGQNTGVGSLSLLQGIFPSQGSNPGIKPRCPPLQAESGRPQFDSWVGNNCWTRDRLPTPIFLSFPGGSAGKESACNVRDLDSIPGLGRSPGEGKGYPLQYSSLENSMDSIVHGFTKSQTQLSHFQSG